MPRRHQVLEDADAVNLAAHDVAGREPARRVEAHAHTGGRTRGDDVARVERHDARHLSDDLGHPMDEVRRIGALARLAVHEAVHAQLKRHGQLVGRDDNGAHGRVGVDRLAKEPLLVALLQAARRHVVEDRVAEDVAFGVLGGDVAAATAEDDGKLDLVVEARIDVEAALDGLAGAEDAHGSLGKVDGLRGLGEAAADDAALGLLEVVCIVDAQAQDVVAGALDGSEQAHRRKRQRASSCVIGERGGVIAAGELVNEGKQVERGQAGVKLRDGQHGIGPHEHAKLRRGFVLGKSHVAHGLLLLV